MRTVIKLDHVSKKFSEEQVLKDVCFRKEKYMESLGIMEVGKQY